MQYYHKPAKSKVAKATKKEGGTSIVETHVLQDYCILVVRCVISPLRELGRHSVPQKLSAGAPILSLIFTIFEMQCRAHDQYVI